MGIRAARGAGLFHPAGDAEAVGKRTVGQFTPFDLLVVVLLGTAVQNSLIGEDFSLLGGLILAATLITCN